jgi:RHS repeat-associated protein
VAASYPAAYWIPAFRIGFISSAFHGSLMLDKADASGQLYRRNRYYDPATGRFTQEDPIGLAGGMNAYGFANGVPVNFSDPFGLCPPKDKNTGDCAWMHEEGLQSAGLLDPIAWLSGGISVGIERGLASAASEATEKVLFEGGKDALKKALSEGVEGINAQQARTLLKNLGEGSVDKIRIATGENGLVSYSTRAGRNGYQTLARVLDESGNLRRMAQGAWDSVGNFVHGEIWKVTKTKVVSCLERFVSGGISRSELEDCIAPRARMRFWDTNERSIEHAETLPVVRFGRADVDAHLHRFLSHGISARDLSDWAATLRLLGCFEVDEPDPGSSHVWDILDELMSPDAWGEITVDSIIDLRRRLSVPK